MRLPRGKVNDLNSDFNEMAYLLKYRLNGGILNIWWKGDDKAHTANVDAGRYRSDDVASFVNYLKSTDGTTLFPENAKSQYVRLE